MAKESGQTFPINPTNLQSESTYVVIYKPFINETSTIDFRLISDNRIDTRHGGEGRKKKRHEFHLCTRFRAPRIYFPPHAKRKASSDPGYNLENFLINLSSNILYSKPAIPLGKITNFLPCIRKIITVKRVTRVSPRFLY